MILDMVSEVGRMVKNVSFRGQDTRGKSETLEILSYADIPINIVLQNEGCGQILLDNSTDNQLILGS